MCHPVYLFQWLGRVRHGRHDGHGLGGAGLHVQRLLQLPHHHRHHLECRLLLGGVGVVRGRHRHGASDHGIGVRPVAVLNAVKCEYISTVM